MGALKEKWSHWLAWSLVVLGLIILAKGAWIPLKAVIAQNLLERAWQTSMQTGYPVKPWPWADTWPVARLSCKRLGVSQIVLEGDNGEVLAFGPGRQENSARLGSPGNSVVVGHRDTSFAFLQNLKIGDVLIIERLDGKKVEYTVQASTIRNSDELYLKWMGEPWLTLITCYPFDSMVAGTDQRFLVFARKQG